MWFLRLIPYIFSAIYIILCSSETRSSTFYDRDNDSNPGLWELVTRKIKNRNRRIAALKKAVAFLKPYEKIFGNLSLSNKFCDLTVNANEKSVTCISKVFNNQNRKMCLVAKDFGSIDINEYFDMMCELFSWNTRYEDVYNSLRAMAVISESVWQINKEVPAVPEQPAETKIGDSKTDDVVVPLFNKVLVDVNNCSEAELTALPGISLVVAKKIIKYREQQRPFKSVEDFITVMNIKPHFAKQLRRQITCNKINSKKVKKAKSERIIDI